VLEFPHEDPLHSIHTRGSRPPEFIFSARRSSSLSPDTPPPAPPRRYPGDD
jgi:hypothetical protein